MRCLSCGNKKAIFATMRRHALLLFDEGKLQEVKGEPEETIIGFFCPECGSPELSKWQFDRELFWNLLSPKLVIIATPDNTEREEQEHSFPKGGQWPL